jgi:hypothetical protein
VLLDAPCTALGLRPRLLQQHQLSLLLDTAAYQVCLTDSGRGISWLAAVGRMLDGYSWM